MTIFLRNTLFYPTYYHNKINFLSLNKIYDSNVIDKACKRALFYETLKYSVIKNICGNGAYNLPLDTNNINGGESYANN